MSDKDQVQELLQGSLTLERIVGGIVSLAGVWLLIYGIPMHISVQGYESPSPQLFPKIGAWIFIVGGIAQIFLAKHGRPLPDLRQFGRYVLVSILLLLMVFLMERFGYLVGAFALMAALMVVVFERRWVWIGVAVVAVPSTVWFLFEIILERPLP